MIARLPSTPVLLPSHAGPPYHLPVSLAPRPFLRPLRNLLHHRRPSPSVPFKPRVASPLSSSHHQFSPRPSLSRPRRPPSAPSPASRQIPVPIRLSCPLSFAWLSACLRFSLPDIVRRRAISPLAPPFQLAFTSGKQIQRSVSPLDHPPSPIRRPDAFMNHDRLVYYTLRDRQLSVYDSAQRWALTLVVHEVRVSRCMPAARTQSASQGQHDLLREDARPVDRTLSYPAPLAGWIVSSNLLAANKPAPLNLDGVPPIIMNSAGCASPGRQYFPISHPPPQRAATGRTTARLV
ncbi:hypothetical protein AcV5_005356 [Taiwanofungus camphoratus]|nr:hypothetical protein AcV5_005356 [Antrodia cinnamomea]